MSFFLRRAGLGALGSSQATLLGSSFTAPISLEPVRFFAKRKRRIKPVKKRKDPNHPTRWTRWRFSEYLEKKDQDVSYWDDECEGWSMHAAMILERSPRLVPEDFEPSWAVEWRQFQDELDLKRKKQVPLEWIETRKSKMEEAAKVFRPNPRFTDADKKNDTKSLHRMLHRPLYLIVKKTGSDAWSLPTAEWHKNETMRESAERMAKQEFGFDLEQYLLGNAPIAHLEQDKDKTFFFHNLWLGGNVILKDNKYLQDFAWVTQRELPDFGIDEAVITTTANVMWEG